MADKQAAPGSTQRGEAGEGIGQSTDSTGDLTMPNPEPVVEDFDTSDIHKLARVMDFL